MPFIYSLVLLKREFELIHQRLRLDIGASRCYKLDADTAYFVDLVVVDLRKDQLLLDAQRIVAAAVE